MADTAAPAIVTSIAKILRILAVLATVSATIVMATSRDTYATPFSDKIIKVDYQDLMFFKAFLGVNIAASLYGIFAAVLPVNSMLWRLIVVLDVIMCVLLASIDSGAMAAAYLHKNGDSEAYWAPICNQVPTFCAHLMGALTAGFVGVGLYLLIIIYSISLVFNPLLV